MATTRADLEATFDFEQILYSRRFSAVAFTHPEVAQWSTLEPLQEILETSRSFPVASAPEGWLASRIAVRSPRNYFTSVNDTSLATDQGYVQEVYVAIYKYRVPSESVERSAILLMAPYVRLLNRLVTRLKRMLDPAHLVYLTPDLDEVFSRFERTSIVGMRATRISVKDESEPTIELVSLTGRNPLKSNLRAELRRVGPAYSIRIDVHSPPHETTVHLDRFGNCWWYHRSESDLTGPLSLFSELFSSVRVAEGRHRPTYRITPSADAD
ncbi:hypothetical protein ABID74_003235 [Gordonia terrae]